MLMERVRPWRWLLRQRHLMAATPVGGAPGRPDPDTGDIIISAYKNGKFLPKFGQTGRSQRVLILAEHFSGSLVTRM